MVHHEEVRRRSGMISDLWKLTHGYGPLVKRLRQRPLTPLTWVRFPHGSPFLGKKSSKNCFSHIVGVDDNEGPPVPIPNTEVKLVGAVGRRQHKHSSIAQPVEHATVNRRVVGSSPTWGASGKGTSSEVLFLVLGPLAQLVRAAGS